MKITDELRKWAHGPDEGDDWLDRIDEFCDRIDTEHDREMIEIRTRGWSNGYDEGFASADDWLAQHEDAMAEHGWVKGPLDADGKMWRNGDMSDSNWGVIEGIAYEDGRWLISGHDMSAPWIPADSIRHYHAPTVEDVLREFAEKIIDSQIPSMHPTYEEAIAEYAAKLQLAEEMDV